MASERKGKIIDGRQGGANIIFDDFIYKGKRVNKNDTVVWKCKNKSKCPSSCLTDELGVLIREPTTHNHDMVIGLATAKVIINDMLKRSREEKGGRYQKCMKMKERNCYLIHLLKQQQFIYHYFTTSRTNFTDNVLNLFHQFPNRLTTSYSQEIGQ